jgi:hypothetical protein
MLLDFADGMLWFAGFTLDIAFVNAIAFFPDRLDAWAPFVIGIIMQLAAIGHMKKRGLLVWTR